MCWQADAKKLRGSADSGWNSLTDVDGTANGRTPSSQRVWTKSRRALARKFNEQGSSNGKLAKNEGGATGAKLALIPCW